MIISGNGHNGRASYQEIHDNNPPKFTQTTIPASSYHTTNIPDASPDILFP